MGFRQNKSTTDNCAVMKTIFKDAKTRKKEIHVAYIDISKAFDSIQHWHIEEVLRYYRIDPTLITVVILGLPGGSLVLP